MFDHPNVAMRTGVPENLHLDGVHRPELATICTVSIRPIWETESWSS